MRIYTWPVSLSEYLGGRPRTEKERERRAGRVFLSLLATGALLLLLSPKHFPGVFKELSGGAAGHISAKYLGRQRLLQRILNTPAAR